MYKYIIDVRYKKDEDNEDPAIVENAFQEMFVEFKVLQRDHNRTEIYVEMETLKEADNMGILLTRLKKNVSSSTTIDCYIVTNKWSVSC